MLIVLLILAVAQFVAYPLLLWVSAKVVRIPGVGIARAYWAFVFLFSLSLEGLASFIFVDLPWPILVGNSCWLIAAGVEGDNGPRCRHVGGALWHDHRAIAYGQDGLACGSRPAALATPGHHLPTSGVLAP